MSRASLRLVTEALPAIPAPLNAGPPTVKVYEGAKADAARMVSLARAIQTAVEGYTTPAAMTRARVARTELEALAKKMGRAFG